MKWTRGFGLAALFMCASAAAEESAAEESTADESSGKQGSDEDGGAQQESEPDPKESSPKESSQDGEDTRLAECIGDHERAQLARLSGGLLKARKHMVACAQSECPEALRNDCAKWRHELDALTPRVVVTAQDDEGDIEAATLSMDGAVLKKSLDGRPIFLDPGTHVLAIETASGHSAEKKIVVSEGEQDRKLSFDFRTPPTTIPEAAPAPKMLTVRPVPPLAYVLVGVSAMGAGLAAGMGAAALSMSNEAEETCAPLCDAQVHRAVKERAIVADVSLSVSLASAAGALLVYLYRPSQLVVDESARRVSVDVLAGPGNARLGLKGAF
jgi:hypothetical protein